MYRRFLILLLLLPVLSYGQRKFLSPGRPPGPPTKADDECAEKAKQCLNSHKYNAKQRRAFYSFSVGGSVRLISYESMEYAKPVLIDEVAQTSDYKSDALFTAMKPDEFVVDYARVKEFRDISNAAIDSLTDILYNVGYPPILCNVYIADAGRNCYQPRNAILFLDKNGKVTQYLEICFACQRHYYSSRKFKEVGYCDGKYDMLRKFFANQGVQYGTKKYGLTD